MSLAPIVVQKYGGSSVGDVDKLRRVARRIVDTRAQGKRVCVVVSAMGDTTDELLALSRRVSPSPPRRELDMLLTTGERISMALLSMAIAELGHEAISFTGSQSGIITNDRHSGARIIEVRPVRIQDELEKGKIVIVAGFQGVSYKREITTLGRGGSDTTAVALAAALGAEYCEICSDVEGVFSADPRIVDAPLLLAQLSYDEMQELAEHGAKVLNPQAVEFARKAGITIFARATSHDPSRVEGKGTRVSADPSGRVGISGQSELVVLRIRGGAERNQECLDALIEEGVSIKRCFTHPEGMTTIFAKEDLPDWVAMKSRLPRRLGTEIALGEDLAAVSVVGEGIGRGPENLRRAVKEVTSLGAEVSSWDASPLRLTVFLTPDHLTAAVRRLHETFARGLS